MRCLKCNANWIIGNRNITYHECCPICDIDYGSNPDKREFSSIVELLQILIIEIGQDICTNSGMINAYLNDYFPAKTSERADISALLQNNIGHMLHDELINRTGKVDWKAQIASVQTSMGHDVIASALDMLSGCANNPGTDFGSVDYYVEQYGIVIEEEKRNALDKALYCDKENKKVLGLIAQYNIKHGNIDEAIAFLENAANNGDIDSLFTIAEYYLDGKAVRQDKSKAEEYLQRALNAGDNRALYKLGALHLTSPDEDYNKATEFLLKASEKGCAEADYSLYALVYGKTDSIKDAMTYIKKAVDASYEPAIYEYAIHLLYGDDIKEDVNQAVTMLDRIARQGNKDAIDKLIYMFSTGFKVAKDKKMANIYRQMKGA